MGDFWKRWHITYSRWLRDYIYIPLGGSKGTSNQTSLNLFITFAICGFWHGANWTFVIWGALHGTYLVTALILSNPKKIISSFLQKQNTFLNKFSDVAITFILVSFAWIFFRANNIEDALYIINHLFISSNDIFNLNEISIQFRGIGVFQEDIVKCILLILILIIYSLFERSGNVWNKLENQPKWLRWMVYYILVFGILFVAPHSNVNNFIYFQF